MVSYSRLAEYVAQFDVNNRIAVPLVTLFTVGVGCNAPNGP